MTEIVTLKIYDFDSLENRNPVYLASEKVFIAKDGMSAHGIARDWLAKQPKVKLSLGYDGNVYPKYVFTGSYTEE